MALWKLNTSLHLAMTNDKGWCLEIPVLEVGVCSFNFKHITLLQIALLYPPSHIIYFYRN
jgi:hypothetical protein